MLKFKAIQTAR